MSNKQLNQVFSVVKTFLAIVIAMVVAFIIILVVSDEPMEALHAFLLGPFTSVRRIGNLIENTIPLIYVGLGVCILWATGKRTLSGEGCYYFGGLMAALASIKIYFIQGKSLTVTSMVIVLIVCGIMALLPMIVNLKYGTDAFVVSLLFNYVMFYIGNYIFSNYLMDITSTSSGSYPLPQDSFLPTLIPGTKVNANLIVALLMIVAVWFFMYKTKWGYSIRLVGLNPNCAKYVGINVFAVCILAQFIGGAISGFGGGMEMFGRNPRFAWFSLTNMGWDGIMVATLAKYKPQYILFSALFLGYVRTGADIMNRSSDVASEIVMIIQAVMILFIGANSFLAAMQQRVRVKYNEKAEKEA
ncbi:MAG: ABC transporter permease [Lachnospiraceae bacterium]|nr:ABC transporter permease [Lachnospiraceae bacterium]